MQVHRPRIVIAGAAGDSGKTIVSLALIRALRRRGLIVAAFKKGPDYIDSAWLSWASNRPARNLDTFMVGESGSLRSYLRHCAPADVSVIEGNRGLYDGADRGAHSTAELAKLLEAPVVLVVPTEKVTRTAAALVLGLQRMDPSVNLAGVILNKTANARHEAALRTAIEEITGVPVLGAIPRSQGQAFPAVRHLGLVTPEEHPGLRGVSRSLDAQVAPHLDHQRLMEIAFSAPALESACNLVEERIDQDPSPVRIGWFRDPVFTFYYQDNLDALEKGGARLVAISSLEDRSVPDIHALYLGGGFPETHGAALSANKSLLSSVRDEADRGLPIYAECGGMIYLARNMQANGERYPLAHVLPVEMIVENRPQGHGYAEVKVDSPNRFFPEGTLLRGHEFHYSRISHADARTRTAYKVLRGAGCFDGRDGIVRKNVLAAYTHVHAAGCPEWAAGLLRAARSYAVSRVRERASACAQRFDAGRRQRRLC